jgi:magnesium transporter
MISITVFEQERMRDGQLSELRDLLGSDNVTVWVEIAKPDDADVGVLQDVFHFHPLAIEDTRNHEQRPKLEEYPGYLFMLVNTVVMTEQKPDLQKVKGGLTLHDIDVQELDIFVGHNYVVTVHLEADPIIQQTKRRIGLGAALHVSASYLLYVLLDEVVDSYFPIMEMFEEEIGALEDRILQRPQRYMLNRLFELKHMMMHMWRAIWPERDILAVLMHPHNLVFGQSDSMQFYLRDVSDHLLWLADMLATYRDTLTTMIDLYMSSVSNQLNLVVNRLTVLTLIIGVMTVVSGFYGMNFEQTWPSFKEPWGVPFVLALMGFGVGAIVLLVKWLRREQE